MHVAYDTPTKSNSETHGQKVVATMNLSVGESNIIKMASPVSAILEVNIDGAGESDLECKTLTATTVLEYRLALAPEKESDTVQLAVTFGFAER